MKSIFKRVAFSALALALVSTTVLSGEQQVRVGIEGAYPPFNWIDESGKLVGFDVEIADALCAAASFDCEFVVQDWDGMIPGLLAKKYDVIIASMGITPERKEKVDFTDKYYTAAGKFVKSKELDLEIPDDIAAANEALSGLVIGVQRSTPHENFVRDNFPAATLKVYATQDEVDLDLVNGRIDLNMADMPALAAGFLSTADGLNYEFVGPDYFDPRWHGDGVGIAVRQGNEDLVGKLNDAIQRIRSSGVYQAINAKYFDFDIYGAD